MDVSDAVITRTVVLALDVLDKYKSNPKLYDYVIGLALVAVLTPVTSVLRSGTTLVRESRKVELFTDLQPVEVIEENGLFDEVMTFAKAAAQAFGVGTAETLTVSIDRIIDEAKGGKQKKDVVAGKKTNKQKKVEVAVLVG
jgi:hypothetical protein